MIKINLLPVRAAKRKETARQQIMILVVSLLVVLGIGIAAYSFLHIKIKSAKNEITRSEQELAELRKKIGKIKDLERLKNEVRRKLDVLNRLRNEKTGPVHRLTELSNSCPDKLWLTKYAESGSSVTVNGIALEEELIADFMRNLESSPDYQRVELIVSEQTQMAGMKMKKFELRFSLDRK